jgi:Tfp pilus assembly protein PilO
VTTRRPLIVGIVSIVAALLVVVALVLPKRSEAKKVQQQLDQANAQTQQLTAMVAELRDAQRAAPSIRRQLRHLDTQVPATADLPGLLDRIKRTADRSAVELDSISPGVPTAAGQYSTIPVELNVAGSFFAVEEFLFHVESFARAAKITSTTLTGNSGGGVQELQASISAEFFTIDTSAGPGSQPGSQAVAGVGA